MKQIKYEVDVGSGVGTGTVFVNDDATGDDILLAIMDDLYSVEYWDVEEVHNGE